MNWKERFLLIILAVINFTTILDFMIMMPLGSFLMPHFAISPMYFSMIVAAYPLTAFFSGLFAAFHVDRYDRKKILLYAYGGFLAGTLCCGIAPSALLLMAARVVTGVFGGLIGAQILSIIADVFPYEKRGRAMSAVFIAFAAASVAGVPFSLYLAGIFSWHAPFLFIGVLGWLLVPLMIRFLPAVRQHLGDNPEAPLSVREVIAGILGNRTQLNALLLSGMLIFGHFMLIPFINPYMEFNKGLPRSQTPLIYMTGGASALIASFVIGRITDLYGKYKVFLAAVVCSIFPILIITNMPQMPLYAMLSVFGLWFAASTARSIPAQAMISTVVEPSARGRFMSFNSSVQQLSTGLASILSGVIVDKAPDGRILHYDKVGFLSAAIVASTIILGKRLARRQHLD